MPNCCLAKSTFKPRVCVNDLSQNTQRFLRLHSSAEGITADKYSPEHQEKFDQLAVLKVKHGVLLDMELTSKLCFSSARGVLDFLDADFTKKEDTHHCYHQTFLKGQCAQAASCANISCHLEE
jgi:hypothetical protein